MKDSTESKLRNFFDRKKYHKDENLRFVALVLLLVMIVGMFLPFTGLRAELTASATVEEQKKEVPLIKPNSPIIQVDLFQLASKQNLGSYKILGISMNDVNLFGINLYGLLTTPFPDFSGLRTANNAINSGLLSFMVSDGFVDFCKTYLGNSAESVISLGEVINDMAKSNDDALDQMVDLLNQLNKASVKLRQTIEAIEGYLGTIGNVVLIVIAVIILGVLLFYFDKGPNWIPKLLLTLSSMVLLGVGFYFMTVNSEIAQAISAGSTELSEIIKSLIDSALPNASGIISSLIAANDVAFEFSLYFFCGLGYWVITISLLACTVFSYITPGMKARRLDPVLESGEKVEDKAVEEAKVDSKEDQEENIQNEKESIEKSEGSEESSTEELSDAQE